MVISRANVDAGGDDPRQAREQILQVIDAVNDLMNGGAGGTSIKSAGAVGDYTGNQTPLLNAVLSVFHKLVMVPAGNYRALDGIANTYGADLAGDGLLFKPIQGGNQLLNLSADRGQHVFGQEYLYAFHESIKAQFGGALSRIVCSGDSTTFGLGGNGASHPFVISDQLMIRGKELGYNVVTVNGGHPGENTWHWRTQYAASDIADNTKLLVLRWGVNDPGYQKANPGVTVPADAGQNYVGRRTIEDYASDLRAGLTWIRQQRPVGDLSILLMTPNSTADTPNGRDELWYEQVRGVDRQAARDFKCAFIDTYAKWNDSRAAAGLWMDDIMVPGGRAIHPKNTMLSWIADTICSLIYPPTLRYSALPGEFGTQTSASLPFDFKLGVNVARCTPLDNFPGNTDGAVVTLRTPDDIAVQFVWDFRSGIPRMPSIRFGYYDQWQDWTTRPTLTLTPQNSWAVAEANSDIRASKVFSRIYLSGTVQGGTTTAGTQIASLVGGYWPISPKRFLVPCGANFDQVASLQVRADGAVLIQSCPSNAKLSLDGINFDQLA